MPVAERKGRSIAYTRIGAGTAVLLVPGIGAGSRLFGTLPRRFQRAGLLCLTFDPVGIAPSSPHAGPWSFEDAGRDILAVLAAEELESVVLVGASLGGKVALATAALAPERVRGLAMVASSAVMTPRSRSVYRFFEIVAAQIEPESIGEITAPFLFGSTFHREKAALVASITRATRPDRAQTDLMIAQARALPSFDGHALARSLRCPSLVLGGTEDTLTAPDEIAETARVLPDAELHMIAGAGHSLLLESAESFDRVVAFVRRLEASRG